MELKLKLIKDNVSKKNTLYDMCVFSIVDNDKELLTWNDYSVKISCDRTFHIEKGDFIEYKSDNGLISYTFKGLYFIPRDIIFDFISIMEDYIG